ncbi:FMR1 neighbor protein [Sorex fumeus]|uniref:FMR1 neighbor protein n=1 Tax=Sorex fumeus TaxID=62283 RepID=UPI0024AD26D0|nr:FMR1 neighbor protein [Sorex fumeus]
MTANSASLRGKNSMRIRILRSDRYRPIPVMPRYTAENPALGSHPGFSVMGLTATRAVLPRPSWEASLRGFQSNRRRPFSRMFSRRRSGLLMLGFWTLMLMGYCMRPGSSIPRSTGNYVLHDIDDTADSSLGQDSTWKTFLSFFFPSTCIPKDNQDSKTCNVQQTLNQSECLRYKCCYSPFGTDNNNCLTPFKDTPTQMFRMFGLGMIGIIILGSLPIFCCSFCRRSKWANSLRRKGSMILKNLKKKQNKLKRFFNKYIMRDGGGGDNGRKQEPEDNALDNGRLNIAL